ncbi:MAG TPA: hypothetical protein VH092_27395, partial [Urbifossiella sp.]|nr:hypothetical protein [Urbifossiella sp.]
MTRFLARSFRSRPARWSVGPVGSRLEELEQRVVPTQAPTQIVTYVSPSPIAISSIDVNDAQSVTGATVRITSGLVPTEDQLLFTNQNGIVGTYTAATGTLTLRGTASGVAYGEALDSIQYSDTAAVPTPGDRTIQFQLGAATYFSGTGHYYQFVSFPVSPTWLTAESDANSRADLGLTGYLATITSQAEQTFVASLVGGSTAWLGGSDAFSGGENVWDWVTGPEGTQNGGAGLPFYNSLGPVGGAYTNWSSGNPNNSASGYVAMSANGTWVSLLNGGTVGGEVVEFGGLGTAPSF